MNQKQYETDLKDLYHISFKLTQNITDAEELAQATLVKAWEKRHQLKDEKSRKAWLRKICTNLFLMEKRKEKGYKPLSLDALVDLDKEGASLQMKANDPLPEEELVIKESIREMRDGCFLAMTRKLTLNQRVVFSLVEMFGMSLKDVAEILNISESASKALLYRARLHLDQFFSNKCQWINETNPCQCEAYLSFQTEKETRKKEVRKRIQSFRFPEEPDRVIYNDEVRQKVKRIYEEMPSRTPNQQWFHQMIEIFKKN